SLSRLLARLHAQLRIDAEHAIARGVEDVSALEPAQSQQRGSAEDISRSELRVLWKDAHRPQRDASALESLRRRRRSRPRRSARPRLRRSRVSAGIERADAEARQSARAGA